MQTTLERELKLDADPAFVLPELAGEMLAPRLFTSTYYDTPPRSLLRSGVTLRRRVENGLSRWQLKLPREGGVRAELEAAGGPAGPPPELRDLLTAHLRHGALAPVATLRTRRTGVRVTDGERRLADVTLDVVDILEGQRQVGAFRELEIELLEGDESDLERLGRSLRRAGAQRSDGRPKVMRALGLGDDAEPGSDLARLGFLLRRQLCELEARDPGVRLGDDPEDVHRMRVATRRTRAIVHATEPVLGDRLVSLTEEFRWLAALLGTVRDLDVLVEHLRAEVLTLAEDRPAGETFVAAFEEERAVARDTLLGALDSPRYLELLARCERELDGLAEADVPDGTLLPIAAAAQAQFRKEARALGDSPSDDELHDLRKRAKRARYAAELATGGDGTRLEKLIDQLKNVQDVIGEHQDAVVAESRLRRHARAKTAVAAGRLIERERARKQRARDRAPKAIGRALSQGKKSF